MSCASTIATLEPKPGATYRHVLSRTTAEQLLFVVSSTNSSWRIPSTYQQAGDRHLLVDPGMHGNVLPASAIDVLTDGHGTPLDAVNGTPIRTLQVHSTGCTPCMSR